MLDRLHFGFGARLPLILQTEATECGLACLGMVAGYHGHRTDLANLRQQFPVSLKGSTLAHLVKMAHKLQLATRALKLDLAHLAELRLPCVLHWNFNHFVVLKAVAPDRITIHDPACGERHLPLAEVSRAFTGVALELWPDAGFQAQKPPPRVRLRELVGRVAGLKRSLLQVLLLALALEVFALVSPFFLQWVIDHALLAADRDLLATLAIGFGLLLLMQEIIAAARGWAILYLSTSLSVQWRANLFSHLLKLPVQYFEKRHLGDVVSRFGAVEHIQRALTTSFVEALLDGLMTIITLAMMFLYSATLAWVAVAAMLLYGAARWAWFMPLRHATEEQIVHAAKQQSHFLETVRGVKAIKLFQRQEERRASWLTLLIDQINADLRTQKMLLAFKVANGVLFGLENIAIIWLGARFVIDGQFTVGALMAFLAYKNQFGTRVSGLIDKFFELKMLQLQGERLADIVQAAPEAQPEEALEIDTAALSATIELRGVRFRYAEHEPEVLCGLDLTIAEGESVAIVGPSGCGKTTLINVMLGILPPTAGEVLIGGQSIRRLGSGALRRIAGTVMQDDVLFAGSIADNISFFDPNADPAWIEACAKMAAVHPEIEAMPMRYNTLVGDMGTVLSGGQKQRVLLARALYKRPKVLFLDEATSHLDIDREHEVNAAIKALQVTRVIVAHRPETIATASRVVVLHGGKVVRDLLVPAQPASPSRETGTDTLREMEDRQPAA